MNPHRPSAATTAAAGWIRRHPVGAFLAWFFTVGQVFAFTPVVLNQVLGLDVLPQPFVVGSTLVGLLLPALVITRITDGPEAVRAFVRRTWQGPGSLGGYAVALVAVPAVTTALALAFFGPPDASASGIAAAFLWGFLTQGVLVLVTNNLWEEAAWTGFVQARLQQRHGALRAAVITGPLFALQHVALVFVLPPLFAVVSMAVFMVIAIPFRALQGWAYTATGSLLVVGLIHATGNAMTGGSGFGGPGMLPRLYENGTVGVLHQLASALIGIAVIAGTRGRLGVRRTPTPAGAPADTRTEADAGTGTPARVHVA